jgi:hypothetical protein
MVGVSSLANFGYRDMICFFSGAITLTAVTKLIRSGCPICVNECGNRARISLNVEWRAPES